MLIPSVRLARVGVVRRPAAGIGQTARRFASARPPLPPARHQPLTPRQWTAVPAALPALAHEATCVIASSSGAASSSSSRALLGAACAALASLLLLGPSTMHAAAATATATDDDSDPALRHTRLPAARVSVETLAQGYTAVPLTLLERARVRDLRAFLQREVMSGTGPDGAEERAYLERWALHDDWALLRYLRAHKHSVGPAAAGLMATIRWRIAERVDDIRVEEFADEYRKGNMYVSSECDPVGRSIVVNRKSTDDNPAHKWDEQAYKREMRSLVYTLERAIRAMEDRVTSGEIDPANIDYKWVMLIDMGGYNRRSATPFHVTRSLIDVLRHHYPERLHCAVIIEAPWLLRTLVQPLMLVVDRVTRNKIVFLPDRKSEAALQMLSLVVGSLDRVPYESGVAGAVTVFDADAYIRHDPLGKPRPTQPRLRGDDTYDSIAVVSSDGQEQTPPTATEQAGATSQSQPKRSWWAVWK